MFSRIGPLAVGEFGILPLEALMSFARQGTDDGTNNEFQEAREFFRDFIEGWDVEEVTIRLNIATPIRMTINRYRNALTTHGRSVKTLIEIRLLVFVFFSSYMSIPILFDYSRIATSKGILLWRLKCDDPAANNSYRKPS